MEQVQGVVKKFLRAILDLFETLVIGLAIFVVLYQFAGQPHQVLGASMEPNFYNREYILTEKISYYFGKPQRGDVVVFKYPQNPELEYIKRVIGLSGDTIKIQDGRVYINEQPLRESYLPSNTTTNGFASLQNNQSYTVPKDQYIVFGDNRTRSSDSREWGFVPESNVVGRAFFRYWPIGQIGFIKHASY